MQKCRIDGRTLGLIALAFVVGMRRECSGQPPEPIPIGQNEPPLPERPGRPFGDREPANPIEALQFERIETLRQLVEFKQVFFGEGLLTLDEMAQATLALLDAELEVTHDPAERVAICEQRLELLQDVERIVAIGVQAATFPQSELLAVQAERMLVEIQLLREQSEMAETDQQGATSPAENDFAGRIETLLQARVETLRQHVEQRRIHFEAGEIISEDYARSLRQLLDAELDAARDPAERIAICERHVELLKSYEAMVDERFQFGELPRADLLAAQADRLQAEIQLLREQAAAE